MDQRLLTAAYSGDVNTLHQLLHQNPFILTDYHLTTSHENPLITAIKANHQAFVHELLRLKPEQSIELSQDGLGPLHIASAYGHVEIVVEILAVAGPGICRLPGKDGITAVHYAAINGRIEIIDKLISTCPDSARDVTAFGESVLHLAVKHFRVEAFKSMLEKFDFVDVVNFGDKEGNTVLHYAASRKQFEMIKLLLDWNNRPENRLELNAVNKKGLTPIDILDILLESSNDLHLRETLRLSGAYPSSQLPINPETSKNPEKGHIQTQKPKNWLDIVKHFEFHWQRDSPGQARETLLLVSALVVAVTFEAGINPPSYLFQRNESIVSSNNNTNVTNEIQRRVIETSNLVSITVFLVANSVALSTAMSIIDYLTVGLPFQRELRVSMLAMIFAYSWSLGSTRPTGTVKSVLLAVAISTPLFLRWLPYIMKCWKRKNA